MNEGNHKLLVINPIVTGVFDRFDEQYLRSHVAPGFEVDVESLKFGVETVETGYDDALSAPYIIDKVLEAQTKRYDGVIINCFRDPGLEAAREASDLIVVGPGEASILFSMVIGDSFSIIDVGLGRYRRFTPPPRVRQLGFSERFVSEWGADVKVSSIPESEKQVATEILSVAKKIEKHDEPDVIILGCTGLSRVASIVANKLMTPLIDPSIAALNMAQALVLSGVKPSRRSYPRPAEKTRIVPGSSRLK